MSKSKIALSHLGYWQCSAEYLIVTHCFTYSLDMQLHNLKGFCFEAKKILLMDCKNENWTSFHYLFWRLKTPLFPAHYPTALSKIPCELYFGKWWWWQCCDGICESKEMDIYKKSKFWWRGELTCGVLSGKMRLVCNNGNNLIYEIVRVHCGLRSWGHLLWPFSGQRIWIGNWLCVECFLCLFIVGFSIYLCLNLLMRWVFPPFCSERSSERWTFPVVEN